MRVCLHRPTPLVHLASAFIVSTGPLPAYNFNLFFRSPPPLPPCPIRSTPHRHTPSLPPRCQQKKKKKAGRPGSLGVSVQGVTWVKTGTTSVSLPFYLSSFVCYPATSLRKEWDQERDRVMPCHCCSMACVPRFNRVRLVGSVGEGCCCRPSVHRDNHHFLRDCEPTVASGDGKSAPASYANAAFSGFGDDTIERTRHTCETRSSNWCTLPD